MSRTSRGLFVIVVLAVSVVARAQSGRAIVVISDLHFGVGRVGSEWSPFEDFRWPKALAGFLDAISQQWGGQIDLVIAGDLLELWQHPSVSCRGSDENHGCTADEALQIVDSVLSAHAGDLRALGSFATRNQNHVYVVPGNHDAALMLPAAAAKLLSAMAAGDRATIVREGRWRSPGGRVLVEHGHQIGSDPNQFTRWPAVSSTIGGIEYLDRPWGEQFVQELYNRVERMAPIIDNLLPLSEGVKLYLGNRDTLGVAFDVARLIRFHVFQTSFSQRVALGSPTSGRGRPEWNVRTARGLGHRLFASALADSDPMRDALLNDSSERWRTARAALDSLAGDAASLPDEEVRALCDQIQLRQAESTQPRATCGALGASVVQEFFPISRVIERHLRSLGRDGQSVEVFVYGHTHQLAFNWTVSNARARSIPVFNTGAFQRLIDEPTLRDLSDRAGVAYSDSLQSLPLESLPACYSAVSITESQGQLASRLENWFMDETSTNGMFVDPCDARCPSAHSPSCPAKGVLP